MIPDWSLPAFLYGVLGGAAVELVQLSKCQTRGRVPKRYKDRSYWLVRVLLAAVGGAVAAVATDTPLLALHVGAATPALIDRFVESPPGLDS